MTSTANTNTSDAAGAVRPLISLCMIVKNEAETLGLCLDDARKVADEMIVVDTGSGDDTKTIAADCGARVFDFGWIDDFAAARNASLTHARGRYIFWLDADDRIGPEAIVRLNALKARIAAEVPCAYAFKVVCKGMFGEQALFYQVRLFPNLESVRFAGKVHESPVPGITAAGLSIQQTDIAVVHTGYDDYEAAAAKVRRNLQILQKSPLESQHPADHQFHLAQCYLGLKDYQGCLEHLETARALGRQRPLYKESYAMLADCLRQTGQSLEAVSALRRAVGEYPHSGQLHHLLGAALTLESQWQEALAVFHKGETLKIEIGSVPVPADIEGRRTYFKARCLEGLGDFPQALSLYEEALQTVGHDPDVLRSYALLQLKVGAPDQAWTYLAKARAKSAGMNKRLWLISARLALALEQPRQALCLYFDMLEALPNDVDALVGVARASTILSNVENLALSLELLMVHLKMETDIDINTPTALKQHVLTIGEGLAATGDETNGAILKEMAATCNYEAIFSPCNQAACEPSSSVSP